MVGNSVNGFQEKNGPETRARSLLGMTALSNRSSAENHVERLAPLFAFPARGSNACEHAFYQTWHAAEGIAGSEKKSPES
jgi:hypothetical protein